MSQSQIVRADVRDSEVFPLGGRRGDLVRTRRVAGEASLRAESLDRLLS